MRQNPQSPQLHMLIVVLLLFGFVLFSTWALPVLSYSRKLWIGDLGWAAYLPG